MNTFLKKILSLGFFSMVSVLAPAQHVLKLIPANRDTIIITPFVEFVKTSRPILLDSVLRPQVQDEFKLLPARAVVFSGYDPYFYWFRFYVENKESTSKDLYVMMGPMGQRDSELFQSGIGGWKSLGKTGNRYKFNDRPCLYTHYAFPISIRHNSVDTFYMSMDQNHNFKTFSFALANHKTFVQESNKVYFVYGVFIGILILFFIFNIYLFFSVREKVHLWYSIYILLLIFLLMKNEGLDEEFLGLDSEMGYRMSPIMGVGALTIFVLIYVTQLFLNNISRHSFIYKFTLVLKFNILAGAIIHFLVFYLRPHYSIEAIVFEWINKSTVAGVLTIFVNCIYSYYMGFKPALFILVGTVIFLLGSLERLLVISTPSYLFPPSLFQIGMLVEAAVISFGLMYSYNLLKKDKELLKAALENQRLELSRQLLKVQETERKRIAEDLHDELGSSLAALKLQLQKTAIPADRLKALLDTVDKASDDTRNISHNLMPPEFEKTALKDLLGNYYLKLNTESEVRLAFHCSGINSRFTKESELVIYRIIMEITSNILKHAHATEATIQLVYYDNYLEIMAEDNGTGIPEQQAGGIGMKNIQSRINYLNGELKIDSGQRGTTLVIQVPFKNFDGAI